jgi:quercetin 2,3-dioxygenase
MDQHANETAIRIKNRHAALHVARLQPANTVSVPDAPYTHIFVARGIVDLEGAGTLNEGDAVRLTGIGGQSITAIDDAEVLIWEMHATAA